MGLILLIILIILLLGAVPTCRTVGIGATGQAADSAWFS